MGHAEKMSPAVAFLLSDDASYITGHNLMVNGGWTAIQNATIFRIKRLFLQLKNIINMEVKNFIDNFAAQFDETDSADFTPETNFKNLEEWSSLLALSIIAMADEEYNVKLKGDDIRNSQTIEELFHIVKQKM